MRRLLLLAAALFLLAPGTVTAQQKTDPNSNVFMGGPKYKKDKKATSRSLKGTVTDDSGKPLEGALVTLKNDATGEKWTFITKQDGRYNFDDLSFTVDYEVAAQFKSLHSEPRKLSQYDHTPAMVRILEVAEAPAGQDKKETAERKAN